MSSSAELRAKALAEAERAKANKPKGASRKKGSKKRSKKRGKKRSSKRSGPDCGELAHAVGVVENARRLLSRAYGALPAKKGRGRS